MSVPEARCASAITACEGYLPVPTMSRERNVLPAITSGSDIRVDLTQLPTTNYQLPKKQLPTAKKPTSKLTAAYEVDDFDLVAVLQHRRVIRVAFDDDHVVLDCDASSVDAQLFEQD